MGLMSPAEYVAMIDDKYQTAKKLKVHRFSMEWGVWSAEMNREIKQRLNGKEDDHKTKMLLKYVFTYWIMRSQMLQLHYERKLGFFGSRIKREAKRCKRIKNLILLGKPTEDLDMKRIVSKMVKDKV